MLPKSDCRRCAAGRRACRRLEEIRLAEDRGHVLTISDFGLLRDDPDIDAPRTKATPIEDGRLRFDGTEVPVESLFSTIGVAPARESYKRRLSRTTTGANSIRLTSVPDRRRTFPSFRRAPSSR